MSAPLNKEQRRYLDWFDAVLVRNISLEGKVDKMDGAVVDMLDNLQVTIAQDGHLYAGNALSTRTP